MPYCECAAKNEMVNYLLCYNGNPDHLAKYCAVGLGMRQSFWNGGVQFWFCCVKIIQLIITFLLPCSQGQIRSKAKPFYKIHTFLSSGVG